MTFWVLWPSEKVSRLIGRSAGKKPRPGAVFFGSVLLHVRFHYKMDTNVNWHTYIALTLAAGMLALKVVWLMPPRPVTETRSNPAEYSRAIKTAGHDCPIVTGIELASGPEWERSVRVTCASRKAYRFTWVAGGAGYRVRPDDEAGD